MGCPEITACCQNQPVLVPLLCSIIAWEQFMGSGASGQMQWKLQSLLGESEIVNYTPTVGDLRDFVMTVMTHGRLAAIDF